MNIFTPPSFCALALSAFVSASLVACSGTSAGPGDSAQGPTSTSTASPSPTTTATATAPPAPPAPPAKASIRFVNAAYQTGVVDFCVRRQGASTWDGPLLAGLGVSGGADQGEMTKSFPLDGGAWDVGVVSRTAASCDKPFATSKSPITLPPGGSALAALRGNGGVSGSEALGIVGIPDESTAPASGKARVRFFHASPNWQSGQAEVWLSPSQPTFTGVAFGQLAMSSTIGKPSAAGYVDVATNGAEITVKGLQDFDGPREVYAGWSAKTGARTTLIFWGAAGSGFYPPTVTSCPDDLTPATESDAFTTCH